MSFNSKFGSLESFCVSTFKSLPIPVSCWTREGKPIFCTNSFLKQFDVKDMDEYVQKMSTFSPVRQPCGEESRALGIKYLQQALNDGACNFLWTHINSAGEVYLVECNLERMTYEGQDVIISCQTNLQNTFNILQNKAKMKERFEAILDAAPISINIWSKEGEVLDCNLATLTLFNLPNKEYFRQNFHEISPVCQPCGRNSRELSLEYIEKTFVEGQCILEWEFISLNGEKIPAEVTLTRIKLDNEDVLIEYTRDLRAIKKTEALAQEAEERMRIMFDSMPLGANFWGKNFEHIDCNMTSATLFGLSSKQEYLERFMELSPEIQPDGRSTQECMVEHMGEVFEHGHCRFEWMHQTLEGEPLPAEITLIRVLYQNEFHVMGYTRDLREYKAMEKKASYAEELNTLIAENIPLSFIFWNKEHQAIDCNQEAMRLLKFDTREDYLKNIYNTLPTYQPDGKNSIDAMKQNHTEAFEKGSKHFEWFLQDSEGELIPMEIFLIRSTLAGEDVVVSYVKDLRELKASEELVKEAELRNTVMLDSLPMNVNFWDDDQQLIYGNAEGVKIFGFESREDFIANFPKIFPQKQPNGVGTQQILTQLFNDSYIYGTSRVEFFCQHSITHDPIPIEVLLVRTTYGGKGCYIAYVRDLREYNAMLKELAENEQALLKAKDFAEQSAKVKGEFLANMSHEIRTPMNGILGLLHLLNVTSLNDTQRNYVEKISLSAKNLMRIINDILDFSKMEAGKLEMEKQPFIMHSIGQEVADLYGHVCADKGLTLDISCSEHDKLPILGDALRFKQVAFNLVSNAIKFTDSGGKILLEAQSFIHNDAELHCKFSVSDTGVGLSAEQASKLFSAFSQADSSVTRKYGGTGLGLAISKKIINLMGGEIWVESEPNKGTTFTFTTVFPLAPQGGEQDEQSKYLETNEAQTTHMTGHLLLVEDNEINQMVAQEILQAVGYTLDIAENGQQALEMLEKNTYNLILMDIQMPVMDGYTATQKIREQEKFATLPIIAMSAHAMKGDKEISLSRGMNDHITKPIDADVLYNALQYWMQKTL